MTLDSIPPEHGGQASGVSATAEQFGGAVGIAALYAIFHGSYVSALYDKVDAAPISDLSHSQVVALRATLQSAEATSWSPAAPRSTATR